jgi:hypothetical protein
MSLPVRCVHSEEAVAELMQEPEAMPETEAISPHILKSAQLPSTEISIPQGEAAVVALPVTEEAVDLPVL